MWVVCLMTYQLSQIWFGSSLPPVTNVPSPLAFCIRLFGLESKSCLNDKFSSLSLWISIYASLNCYLSAMFSYSKNSNYMNSVRLNFFLITHFFLIKLLCLRSRIAVQGLYKAHSWPANHISVLGLKRLQLKAFRWSNFLGVDVFHYYNLLIISLSKIKMFRGHNVAMQNAA